MTEEPAGRRATAACYFASFVALGLVASSLGPTLPGLAEQTRSHLGSASALFVARSCGYFGGTLAGGRAFDRLRGHPVLVGVFVAMIGAMALAPEVPALAALAGILFVVGVAEGMLDVGVNTLIVWEFRRRAGPFLNALHAFFGVGACAAPVVVAWALAGGGGIAWAYRALALALVPLPLWLARLESPAPWAPARERAPGAPDPRVDRRLLALVTLFFVVYTGSEGTIAGWTFAYTTASRLGGEAEGAYLTAAFWGALAVGRTLTIPAAARFRPRAILAVALSGGLASALVVLAAPGSAAALWAGTIGAGLAVAAVFPTALSLAGRHMPVSGAVNSWLFAGASAGGMAMPWVVGQFFESAGPRVVYALVAADLAASLAVLGAITLYLGSKKSSGPQAAA
jgi:fucose permease